MDAETLNNIRRVVRDAKRDPKVANLDTTRMLSALLEHVDGLQGELDRLDGLEQHARDLRLFLVNPPAEDNEKGQQHLAHTIAKTAHLVAT